MIISVCGAADLGKSYLCSSLVETLQHQGYHVAHLPLDSYLMSREQRINHGISGYDTEAYDFATIIKNLTAFKVGKEFSFTPYNHEGGTKQEQHEIIGKNDILLLDGLHAMDPRLIGSIDFTIFIHTDDARLRNIRREADLIKRKQQPELSEKFEPVEFQKYKRFVEPYKQRANLVLYLQLKWQYEVRVTDA